MPFVLFTGQPSKTQGAGPVLYNAGKKNYNYYLLYFI